MSSSLRAATDLQGIHKNIHLLCIFYTFNIIDLYRSEPRQTVSLPIDGEKVLKSQFTDGEPTIYLSTGIVCNHNFFVCCGMLSCTSSLISPLPFTTSRVMRFPLLGDDDALSHLLPRFSFLTSDGQRLRCLPPRLGNFFRESCEK